MTRWTVFFLAFLSATPALAAGGDKDAIVQGNNAFALDLYDQLRHQDGNLFFSPESISTALAMTYAGARGETAAEMAKVLHFNLPPERLHPAMSVLLHDLNAAHDGYELHVANALWGQQGYPFLDDFLKLTNADYGAGFKTVDFKGATEEARLTINGWVERQTANKIVNLLQPGVLTPTTRLVLTNAVYFKGEWQTRFDKARTREEDFYVTPAQTVRAPLMHLEGKFNYLDGGSFQALEIPYNGNNLSIVVFLPKVWDGLSAFERSMTPEQLQVWLGNLQPRPHVLLSLPRFKLENSLQLKDTLSTMGMRQPFDAQEADFSGIASRDTMQANGNLYISAVIHKAYASVDEEGTEAAAATAVNMPVISMPLYPTIILNHPFFFLIRDTRSGSIHFMGRVVDPTK